MIGKKRFSFRSDFSELAASEPLQRTAPDRSVNSPMSLTPGSEDGKIHVWNAESGMKVALLDGKHTGPITCLQFNPKFMTFASACSNMVRGACRVETRPQFAQQVGKRVDPSDADIATMFV